MTTPSPAAIASMAAELGWHYSSADLCWETPAALFEVLDREFRFTLDVCAVAATAKCERYFSPAVDGLAQSWAGERAYMNPPYGRDIGRWVQKAHETAAAGAGLVVALLPARTDTGWWWRHVLPAEVRFLPGRLRFGRAGAAGGPAPFPSAVAVYRPGLPAASCSHWNWRAAEGLALGRKLNTIGLNAASG